MCGKDIEIKKISLACKIDELLSQTQLVHAKKALIRKMQVSEVKRKAKSQASQDDAQNLNLAASVYHMPSKKKKMVDLTDFSSGLQEQFDQLSTMKKKVR